MLVGDKVLGFVCGGGAFWLGDPVFCGPGKVRWGVEGGLGRGGGGAGGGQQGGGAGGGSGLGGWRLGWAWWAGWALRGSPETEIGLFEHSKVVFRPKI